MEKKYFTNYLFALVCLVFSLVSCKKEGGSINNAPSMYLKSTKSILYYSSDDGPVDTIYTNYSFNYNEESELTSYSLKEYHSFYGVNGILSRDDQFNIKINSTTKNIDNIVCNAIGHSFENIIVTGRNSYSFFYNQENQIIKVCDTATSSGYYQVYLNVFNYDNTDYTTIKIGDSTEYYSGFWGEDRIYYDNQNKLIQEDSLGNMTTVSPNSILSPYSLLPSSVQYCRDMYSVDNDIIPHIQYSKFFPEHDYISYNIDEDNQIRRTELTTLTFSDFINDFPSIIESNVHRSEYYNYNHVYRYNYKCYHKTTFEYFTK